MNQYQRMVSYLYEYKQGVKGANVGYVKIEQRGSICRISLQMRGRNWGQIPSAALFHQEENGILYFPFGTLSERNGDYCCRVETDVDNLFENGVSLQEVEGLLLYLNEDYYVATTWKNHEIYLGEMRKWKAGMEPQNLSVPEKGQEEQEETEAEHALQDRTDVQSAGAEQLESETQAKQGTQTAQNLLFNRQAQENQQIHNTEEEPEQKELEAQECRVETEKRMEEERRAEAEKQAVCGNCPFKRGDLDYGKRILMSFPNMRPFPEGGQYSCVRMEPQDLGCLPMPLWSLANNQFLLQGYYCYRHLIFVETGERKYALGVPGIYSGREQEQARQFGFTDFRPICKGRRCMGGFGYWMMTLDNF